MYEIVETNIGFEVLKDGQPIEYGRAWTTREQAAHQITLLQLPDGFTYQGTYRGFTLAHSFSGVSVFEPNGARWVEHYAGIPDAQKSIDFQLKAAA